MRRPGKAPARSQPMTVANAAPRDPHRRKAEHPVDQRAVAQDIDERRNQHRIQRHARSLNPVEESLKAGAECGRSDQQHRDFKILDLEPGHGSRVRAQRAIGVSQSSTGQRHGNRERQHRQRDVQRLPRCRGRPVRVRRGRRPGRRTSEPRTPHPCPGRPARSRNVAAGPMAACASVPSQETITKSINPIIMREIIIAIIGAASTSSSTVGLACWNFGARGFVESCDTSMSPSCLEHTASVARTARAAR